MIILLSCIGNSLESLCSFEQTKVRPALACHVTQPFGSWRTTTDWCSLNYECDYVQQLKRWPIRRVLTIWTYRKEFPPTIRVAKSIKVLEPGAELHDLLADSRFDSNGSRMHQLPFGSFASPGVIHAQKTQPRHSKDTARLSSSTSSWVSSTIM